MTQARFGRGQNSGRNGRGSENGRGQGRGHGAGYTSKPKTSKVGLCKELEDNILTIVYQTPPILCALRKRTSGSTLASNMGKILPMN